MERKIKKLLLEAKSCVEKGNLEKAITIYEKAVGSSRGSSDYAYCLFSLACTLHDHKEIERAAALFEELKELYSHERPLAMKKLDSIYKQIGDINRRVAILEELSKSQELKHDYIECSRTLIELSQIYIEMKRFENAESACLKALQVIEEVIGKKTMDWGLSGERRKKQAKP